MTDKEIREKSEEIAKTMTPSDLPYIVAKESSLRMADWLKHEMIQEVCEWLRGNKNKYAVYDEDDPFYDDYVRVSDKIIDDIRRALE